MGPKPLDLKCRFCYLYTCPLQHAEISNLKAAKFTRLSYHVGKEVALITGHQLEYWFNQGTRR